MYTLSASSSLHPVPKRDGLYVFTSKYALTQCLNIFHDQKDCLGAACSHAIGANKQQDIASLLDKLFTTVIPSCAAQNALRRLSKKVACRKAWPAVYDGWCSALWEKYLSAHGLDPAIYDQKPSVFERDVWQHYLHEARRPQHHRKSTPVPRIVSGLLTPPASPSAPPVKTPRLPPPVTKRECHIPGFAIYKAAQTHNDRLQYMRKTMINPVKATLCYPGYVYVLQPDDEDGIFKIGYSQDPNYKPNRAIANRTEERLKCWKRCGKNLHKAHEIEIPCNGVQRIEHMVHATLWEYRREEYCSRCRRTHIEWFEVDLDTIKKVLDLWARFARQQPYRKDEATGCGAIEAKWREIFGKEETWKKGMTPMRWAMEVLQPMLEEEKGHLDCSSSTASPP